MSKGRGAFLVFEGCDRAGKSTQVKKLLAALKEKNIPVETRVFPDRKTAIGQLISSVLSKKEDLPAETMHLLFSANKWECKHDILKTLQSGVTLIVDRYAASGAAYSAANTGRSLDWCKESDKGLPSPDMIVLLKVSPEAQVARGGWGEEKYEKTELQQRVAQNYEKLMDENWTAIDANQDVDKIHSEILAKVLPVIETVKDSPIHGLYEHGTRR